MGRENEPFLADLSRAKLGPAHLVIEDDTVNLIGVQRDLRTYSSWFVQERKVFFCG